MNNAKDSATTRQMFPRHTGPIFAIECHWSEDWAVTDYESHYIYLSLDAAVEAGFSMIDGQDAPEAWKGFYVISDERDDWDEPVIENLYGAHGVVSLR